MKDAACPISTKEGRGGGAQAARTRPPHTSLPRTVQIGHTSLYRPVQLGRARAGKGLEAMELGDVVEERAPALAETVRVVEGDLEHRLRRDLHLRHISQIRQSAG